MCDKLIRDPINSHLLSNSNIFVRNLILTLNRRGMNICFLSGYILLSVSWIARFEKGWLILIYDPSIYQPGPLLYTPRRNFNFLLHCACSISNQIVCVSLDISILILHVSWQHFHWFRRPILLLSWEKVRIKGPCNFCWLLFFILVSLSKVEVTYRMPKWIIFGWWRFE